MTTPTIVNTGSNYARGINKTVCIVGEATFGTAPAAGAGVGQLLRRTSAVFNMQTTLIASQEITVSQQTEDARQGPRSVTGTLSGQLSCGTYDIIWEGLLRANFAAQAPIAAVTDLVIAAGSGTSVYTFTSAAQNWNNDGIYTGDCIRLTGGTSTYVANNGDNFHVLSEPSAHVLNVLAGGSGTVLQAAGAGQSLTVTVAGKRCYTPATGQIIPSFTVEEWYGDIGVSDLSTGCRVTQVSINIPASGYATLQASFTGQNQVETNSQVYTAANPESTTLGLTAVGGQITYRGAPIAYISSMSLQIAATASGDPVVGSNIAPDVFLGQLSVQGSFSCMFAADTMTTDFLNESIVDLSMILTDQVGNPNANFFKIYLPTVKLASQSKTDTDRMISRSFNFRAMRNLTDTTKLLTTIVIQDDLA